MLHHVVLLRFVPGTEDAHIDRIIDELRGLPERIDVLDGYRVGRDLGLAAGNAHLVVIADLADAAAYATYRDHPEHRRVIQELVAPVLEHREAVQFASGPAPGAASGVTCCAVAA